MVNAVQSSRRCRVILKRSVILNNVAQWDDQAQKSPVTQESCEAMNHCFPCLLVAGQDLFKTLRLVFGYEFIAKVRFEAMFLRL